VLFNDLGIFHMEKAFVAQRVANKLLVTEAAVDGALVEAAELMSEMLKARRDMNVSTEFADDAQVKLMAAMKSLSDARTAMGSVHSELNEAQLRLGLRTKMTIEKPFAKAKHAPKADLRDVG
jgi:flagellin-like hook-associated protein FlgL